jgi:CspA family cold shock protein
MSLLILNIVSTSLMAAQLHQGRVKWFDSHSGYGFIQPEPKEEDLNEVFFHVSVIEGKPKTVTKGQKVSYEMIKKDNKLQATRVIPHPL